MPRAAMRLVGTLTEAFEGKRVEPKIQPKAQKLAQGLMGQLP
jgi:hypothetical protein